MAVYPQVVLTPDPVYLQAESYSAQDDRRDREQVVGPGVVQRNDFLISFVSGRTVRAAAGVAYILGRNVADQGLYRQSTSSTFDVTHNAGDATNPRVDQVILRVMDNSHDAAGFNECRMEAVPGAPTAGATLANRTGALNLEALGEASKNYLLLADVLVPAGASTLLAGNIVDRRTYCNHIIPKLIAGNTDDTYTDFVFCPHEVGGGRPAVNLAAADIDGTQAVSLFYLPKRMGVRSGVSVSRITWGYRHGGTALTGNWLFAIYEPTGRLITSATGTFSSSGPVRPIGTLSPTVVDMGPGPYYALFGADTTNAGTISVGGAYWQSPNYGQGPVNMLLSRSGLGAAATTPPTNLRDVAWIDSLSASTVVPDFALGEL